MMIVIVKTENTKKITTKKSPEEAGIVEIKGPVGNTMAVDLTGEKAVIEVIEEIVVIGAEKINLIDGIVNIRTIGQITETNTETVMKDQITSETTQKIKITTGITEVRRKTNTEINMIEATTIENIAADCIYIL